MCERSALASCVVIGGWWWLFYGKSAGKKMRKHIKKTWGYKVYGDIFKFMAEVFGVYVREYLYNAVYRIVILNKHAL